MSADEISWFSRENETRNQPNGNACGTQERRFGEVVITAHREVVLRCLLCEEEHRIYKNFLEHILIHYYAETKISKKCGQRSPVHCEIKRETLMDDHQSNISSDEIGIKSETLSAAADVDAAKDPLSEEEMEDLLDTASNDSFRELPPLLRASSNHNRKRSMQKERKYKCETCGAAFTDSSNMRSHSRRHTGQKPHACDQCEMRFYTTTELASHVRHRHTGERPFVCSYCGQDFTTSSHMRNHERRHSDYRAFKCDICDKRFHDSTRLKDHMAVHTQERNHVCNICNASFTRRKNLKQHFRLHVNAREYACDLCDMAFNQMPALWLHKKNKHKVVKPIARKIKSGDKTLEETV